MAGDVRLPDITSRVRLDTSDIDAGVGRSKSALGGLGKVFAGALAGVAVGGIFKDVIGGASDLNETISKSNTIFGAAGKEMEAWAGTAAKTMGQSKQGALDAAATFGNLFVQLGSGSGEAAKMSKEMVGLASDFASFHNADPTDVIESMTAAFRGEYDAVQKYVPTINAAAVEQEALKMGLAKTTKELTAQDKALATQSLLMSGAGAAVGDFAKTSDGLANRQRILAAQFKDTKDKLGTALLPVVLQAMEKFLALGAAIAGPVKAAFAGAKAAFAGFAEAFKSVMSGEGWEAHGALERIGVAIATVVNGIRDNAVPVLAGLGAAAAVAFGMWAAAAIPAAAATIAAAAPALLLAAAIAALAAGLVYAYQNFEGFRTVVDAVAGFLVDTVWPKIQQFAGFIAEQFGNLVGFVQQHWGAIQEAISHVVNVVQAVIESFVGHVQAVWQAWGDEITNIARIVWDQIRTVVETVVGVIQGVIAAGLAIINGEWGAAWDAIKGILDTAMQFIRDTVSNGIALAREAFEGGVSAIVALAGGIPGSILGALGDLGGLLYNAGRSIMEGLGRGIKDAVQGVYDFVSGIAGKIASLKGPIEKDRKLLIPAGQAIMDSLVIGLKDHEGRLVRQLAHVTGLIQGVDTAVPSAVGLAGRSTNGAGSPSPVLSAASPAVAAAPPVVHTTIVIDRKVLAQSVSQGQYEAGRR